MTDTQSNWPETEFYQDVKGEWRWRSTAKNGEIYAAAHEGFETKWGAELNWERATGNLVPGGRGQ